jgi:hypothetical protein
MHAKMGPLSATHPLVDDEECPACHYAFEEGDHVTLIELGPGPSPDDREAARRGATYTAVAVPVHWACATGEEG